MKERRMFCLVAAMCALLMFLTACAGERAGEDGMGSDAGQQSGQSAPVGKGNDLLGGASPETSALGMYYYDGEVLRVAYLFHGVQEILDELGAVPAAKVEDWSPEQAELPVYGLEIGTADGEGIRVAWSDGYWIDRHGEVYALDYDFAALWERDGWEHERELGDFSAMPCARLLVQDDSGWHPELMSPAAEPEAPEGISAEFVMGDGDQLTLRLRNESGADFMYGEYFRLDVQLDGIWYTVPATSDKNWAFTDIGYMLADGQTQEMTCHLMMYGELPAGEIYRVVMEGVSFEFAMVDEDITPVTFREP